MNLAPHIKGLIFDCDGTLADSMPLHWRAWQMITQRHRDTHLTRRPTRADIHRRRHLRSRAIPPITRPSGTVVIVEHTTPRQFSDRRQPARRGRGLSPRTLLDRSDHGGVVSPGELHVEHVFDYASVHRHELTANLRSTSAHVYVRQRLRLRGAS